MSRPAPRVSIIIPAYFSAATLHDCLRALQEQSYRSFEVFVVNSSDDETSRAIVAGFTTVRYLSSERRLLPHAARNLGVAHSSGELLLFTDPDLYHRSDWLAQLISAHDQGMTVVAGAVACYGRKWAELGAHLCKYDSWLPGGPPRRVTIAPTSGLLCPKAIFDAVGGFREDIMLGDTFFCWRLAERNIAIWLAPAAIAEHHHFIIIRRYAQERLERGREFARLRLEKGAWPRRRLVLRLLITLLPLRLVKLLGRAARHALAAGMGRDFLWTLPWIVLGHEIWLLGEAQVYLQRLVGRSRSRA
jgi:GT2 family glycosyltransferase